MQPVEIKASLLSSGLRISEVALSHFGLPYLEKRRAYGNPDPIDIVGVEIPQELYILPSRLVVSINVSHSSPWSLEYLREKFYVTSSNGTKCEVTFPLRPKFYEEKIYINKPENVSQVISLYGGSSLGAFVYGNCSLVEMGEACQYCSIKPNRNMNNDFKDVITKELLCDSIRIALRDRTCKINQVMINGGNFPDPDKSFLYYVGLASARP